MHKMRVLIVLLTSLMALILNPGTPSYMMAGIFVSTLMPGVVAQECAVGTAQFVKGNWYCSAVDSISYRNFPGTGHYNRVVHMDTLTGVCKMEKLVYSGSLSPLNEELAIHVRGPTWIKQFAVYTPESPSKSLRDLKHLPRDPHRHKHALQHGHHRRDHSIPNRQEEHVYEAKRAVGDPVTATINGEVVTWENKYAGPNDKEKPADSPHGVGEMVTATINGHIASWTNQYSGPDSSTTEHEQADTPSPVVVTSQPTSVASVLAVASSAVVQAFEKAAAKISSAVQSVIPVQSSIASTPLPQAPEKVAPKVSSVVKSVSSTQSVTASTLPVQAFEKAVPKIPSAIKDVATPVDNTVTPSTSEAQPTPTSTTSAIPSSKTSTRPAPSDSWTRQAYYNAGQGLAEGLVFLNHFGNANALPGFGASLSYASHNGVYGVESPQILSDAMLKDNTEIVIMSDKSCEDGGCGYTRPGGLAYHGFGGDHKIFLMEFSMPVTGNTGFNADMPAYWIMNAQIALTSQYGQNQNCSCWSSGCGELDVFEVLDSGNTRCKSTLHMWPAGGSSDYFERPINDTIKVAVVLYGKHEMATIQLLDDIVAFPDLLTADYIEQFIADLPPPRKQSVFKLVAT